MASSKAKKAKEKKMKTTIKNAGLTQKGVKKLLGGKAKDFAPKPKAGGTTPARAGTGAKLPPYTMPPKKAAPPAAPKGKSKPGLSGSMARRALKNRGARGMAKAKTLAGPTRMPTKRSAFGQFPDKTTGRGSRGSVKSRAAAKQKAMSRIFGKGQDGSKGIVKKMGPLPPYKMPPKKLDAKTSLPPKPQSKGQVMAKLGPATKKAKSANNNVTGRKAMPRTSSAFRAKMLKAAGKRFPNRGMTAPAAVAMGKAEGLKSAKRGANQAALNKARTILEKRGARGAAAMAKALKPGPAKDALLRKLAEAKSAKGKAGMATAKAKSAGVAVKKTVTKGAEMKGRRGGTYVVTSTGKKVYVSKSGKKGSKGKKK